MKAKLVTFGEILIEGVRYTSDVVTDGGRIRRRRKRPSKALWHLFGHTRLMRPPLSTPNGRPGSVERASVERQIP